MSVAGRARALRARLSRLEGRQRPGLHVIVRSTAGLSEDAMLAAYEDESGRRVGPDDFLVVIAPTAPCDPLRAPEDLLNSRRRLTADSALVSLLRETVRPVGGD